MAAVFNGTTAKVTTALTAHSTLRTFFSRVLRTGTGGANIGRWFEKRTSGGQIELCFWLGATLRYYVQWSTGQKEFEFGSVALTDTWYAVGISYDAGAAANDPVLYTNGTVSGTQITDTASGAVSTNTDAYVIGNRGNDDARGWDGQIAEWAVWDAILTASEHAALAKGLSPLAVRPAALVSYLPLVRSGAIDYVGAPATPANLTFAAHPRIIMPA